MTTVIFRMAGPDDPDWKIELSYVGDLLTTRFVMGGSVSPELRTRGAESNEVIQRLKRLEENTT